MLNRLITAAAAAGLLVALHSGPLFAQTTAPGAKANYSADLIVGGPEENDPTTAWLGLDVRLASGWHTYWRSAGDAGAPPEFDWSGSRNVAEPTVEWPAPRRFSDAGIDTFGYADRVLFPIKVRLRDKNENAHVSLKLALYVCSTICTRNDLQLEADVTPGFRFANKQILIDEWRSKVPRGQSLSMTIQSVRLESRPPAQLRIEAVGKPPLIQPDAFVDGDNAVVAGRPQITTSPGGVSLITLPLEGVDSVHPNQPLRVTLVDGDRSVETVLPQRPPAPTTEGDPSASSNPANLDKTSVWSMIVLSLLGGFILNFMPCVFPVLSLKLFSLLSYPSQHAGAVRARFAASAAGVITSFIVLAAILAMLKSAGAQIGWGIQFQQPLFLIGMVAILTALGANLLGLYEIRLPWRLARPLGQSAGGQSIGSHFFNGFVMTLLATPCSAPFVGTAVAFALSQGPLQIFEIFVGLGLGMASPYLVLTAVPQVARLFPRPGRWMLTIRYIAAAAMVATAIWLLTILAQVSGVQIALFVGAFLGLLIWVLAIIRRRFAHTIAAFLIVALTGTAIVAVEGQPRPGSDVATQEVLWQPFAPKKIEALVQSGHTVFVDVGAAWCVTCKVNEALIINSDPIRQRLKSDIAPIRADWTRPDDTITAYLQSFGRYGLPFNAVFGPGAPGGIVLPELLTQEAVLNAFNTASNRNLTH